MSQKEKNKRFGIPDILYWALPVLLWVILSFFSYEFLLKVEERSFFEFDVFWFKEFLAKPSGILSWCGLFLTQFLHIPWLGSLVWVVLLALSARLTVSLFRIPSSLSALAYLPAAIMVAYNMSTGYLIYIMNLPGFFFMPVLGYLWALFTVFILRKVSNPVVMLILYTAWGMAGYYLAGFYGLAAILLAGIDQVVSGKSRMHRLMPLAGAAVSILLAPILFIGMTTYNLADGWAIGLQIPTYGMTFSRVQFPLILSMLLLLAAPLAGLLDSLSDRKPAVIIQYAALAVAVALPAIFWYRDDNFKAELGMIRSIDNLEWNDAVRILDDVSARHEKDASWQPTRVMVLLKDLALIKTGKEADRAFGYDDGDKKQNSKITVPMSFQIGRILYLHYGIPGVCHRWCIEESVFFGFNNMTFKYLAMNSILLGDNTAADKYLDRLSRTIFYRKWAKQQQELCRSRDLVDKTAPYNLIVPLMCYDDEVRSDMDGCEFFLLEHFNGIRPDKATPLYDRVALFFAMKYKDQTLFWTRFFLYLDSNNPQKIGRYYQEAAYLFGNISRNEILEALPFDQQTKDLYNAFRQRAVTIGSKSLLESKPVFTPTLRHTYYYYYYYVNELQMF